MHDTDRFLENHPVFSKFQFPGQELDRLLENSSIYFLWVPIQFLQNIGAWTRPISGKLVHIRLNFPEIGVYQWYSITPGFFEYRFSTKCSILDEFSRNRPVSCLKIMKLTIGWIFHKSIQLPKCIIEYFLDWFWSILINWISASKKFLFRPTLEQNKLINTFKMDQNQENVFMDDWRRTVDQNWIKYWIMWHESCLGWIPRHYRNRYLLGIHPIPIWTISRQKRIVSWLGFWYIIHNIETVIKWIFSKAYNTEIKHLTHYLVYNL